MTIQTKQQIFSLEHPPTPQCHASTIAEFEGRLYAAWFGGLKEGADDVGIWLSMREGDAWSEPVCMAQGGVPHWNPVLFSFAGQLFLYYKKGKPIPGWYTCLRVLRQGVWSPERELVPGDIGGRGPVKNKPIQLKSGMICAPASLEYKEQPEKGEKWQAFADLSEDGMNWRAQPVIEADVRLIQPTLWESDAGLHALMRSDAGLVYRSDSEDGGRNWCSAYATGLPNNNSGIDAAQLDGKLYLVHNPVGENWGPRTPLIISVSDDDGQTWREAVTLEDAPGEYSYPSMIAEAGMLRVVYTHNRRGIVYAAVRS